LSKPLSTLSTPTFIKRGRPVTHDRSTIKSATMTICLTPDIHRRLLQYSYTLRQPPAKMVRMIVEEGLSGRDEDTVDQGE
jgi:hypothetical protein